MIYELSDGTRLLLMSVSKKMMFFQECDENGEVIESGKRARFSQVEINFLVETGVIVGFAKINKK